MVVGTCRANYTGIIANYTFRFVRRVRRMSRISLHYIILTAALLSLNKYVSLSPLYIRGRTIQERDFYPHFMNIGAAAQLRGWGTPDSVSGNFFGPPGAHRVSSGRSVAVGGRGVLGAGGALRSRPGEGSSDRLRGSRGGGCPGLRCGRRGGSACGRCGFCGCEMRRIPTFLLYLYGRPAGAQSPAGVLGGILRCGVMASGPKKSVYAICRRGSKGVVI